MNSSPSQFPLEFFWNIQINSEIHLNFVESISNLGNL
jgi:hypothetical protein